MATQLQPCRASWGRQHVRPALTEGFLLAAAAITACRGRDRDKANQPDRKPCAETQGVARCPAQSRLAQSSDDEHGSWCSPSTLLSQLEDLPASPPSSFA